MDMTIRRRGMDVPLTRPLIEMIAVAAVGGWKAPAVVSRKVDLT